MTLQPDGCRADIAAPAVHTVTAVNLSAKSYAMHQRGFTPGAYVGYTLSTALTGSPFARLDVIDMRASGPHRERADPFVPIGTFDTFDLHRIAKDCLCQLAKPDPLRETVGIWQQSQLIGRLYALDGSTELGATLDRRVAVTMPGALI
jgi:hypothetical protein